MTKINSHQSNMVTSHGAKQSLLLQEEHQSLDVPNPWNDKFNSSDLSELDNLSYSIQSNQNKDQEDTLGLEIVCVAQACVKDDSQTKATACQQEPKHNVKHEHKHKSKTEPILDTILDAKLEAKYESKLSDDILQKTTKEQVVSSLDKELSEKAKAENNENKELSSEQVDQEFLSVSEQTDSVVLEQEGFEALGLSPLVLKAIKHEGFELPTPIQKQAIPVFLSGVDMIGQAQTGTGKTAAFAMPILSKLPKRQRKTFALILEPTRELAIQVSESFSRFAHFMPSFKVVPIYGGASYENQIRSLRHGAQVVVATPGRLIDLIEKGRLDFSEIQYVVIDEADEMLRMGFIDDVNWILEQVPNEHQTALFSATMPPAIRRIAHQHLNNPTEVKIKSQTTTATTVRQRYWVVSGVHKIDAMTRMLEVEHYEAVLVFVRTKTDAEDVATKLSARGLACTALHGDIAQRQREKIIERLKNGSLDIVIATDVAARGLDVDRITHVFNYDIPYDAESYVHRIGRTGRAGRTGEAILFVSPRERGALRQIERVTRHRIEPMQMPTIADVNKRRLENFRNQVLETIATGDLEDYINIISDLLSDDSLELETLAAALAKMAQRDGDLLLDDSKPEPKMRTFDDEHDRSQSRSRGPSAKASPLRDFPDLKMVRYRLAVGRKDGVKPSQIVGAIANEANIESKYIGEILLFDTFSVVDLPEGMPKETMQILAKARVCGRALELRIYYSDGNSHRADSERTFRDENSQVDHRARRSSHRSSHRTSHSQDGFKSRSSRSHSKGSANSWDSMTSQIKEHSYNNDPDFALFGDDSAYVSKRDSLKSSKKDAKKSNYFSSNEDNLEQTRRRERDRNTKRPSLSISSKAKGFHEKEVKRSKNKDRSKRSRSAHR